MSTRKFSRVHFNVEASVKAADRQFQASVENLSMTGMFLVTSERLPVGELVDITMELSGVSPEIAVNFIGKVSRIVENGLGIVLEKIDLDSYVHLKNIVAYNIDDAEKVREEICQSLDEKLAADR